MLAEHRARSCGPWVDINLAAISENYRFLARSAPGARIGAVVKCDGYGLGAAQVARQLLKDTPCDVFFVAYPEEGAALRSSLGETGRHAEIYVFSGPDEASVSMFRQLRLTPVINSVEQAECWRAAAPGAPAALHIDTGMNRLGLPPKDAGAVAAMTDLNIRLTLSHLACASAPADPHNRAQCELFAQAAALFPSAQRSLSASAGALMDKRYHFDLVRAGVALYGGSPFAVDEPRLRPVAALRAPIVQLRNIGVGETVGYDATFTAQRPTRLAAAALGYGDGFPRSGQTAVVERSNGSSGVAPIVGRISMDTIVLDVSDLAFPASLRDVACFFGTQITLHEAARQCGAIPYELITGLGARVDRRYL